MEKGHVADQHRHGASGAECQTDTGGCHTIDAVHSTIGKDPQWTITGEPLDIPHRHGRRKQKDLIVPQFGTHGTGDPWFGDGRLLVDSIRNRHTRFRLSLPPSR